MKLGKDTVVSVQKYTETFRNTAKTCLIVNTVSKIEKNEEIEIAKKIFEEYNNISKS